MIVLRYVLVVVVVLNAVMARGASWFDDHFRLLPRPQQVTIRDGRGIRFSDLRNIRVQGLASQPVIPAVLQHLPLNGDDGEGSITLVVEATLAVNTEGYLLDIADGKLLIRGRDDAGVFYGLQTLAQLAEDARDQDVEIPSLSISDYPDIAYRAVHLDLKHHLDAADYYYRMVDRLAGIKVNAIIVEFEDKLRYRKAPEVGAPHAISIEEFAALSRYAKARHIEISPLVQGLGHASFILKHPIYHALRDNPASDWVFDPMNPATYDLQFALYEDAIAATPYGRYLHVGGDEVGKLGHSDLSRASGKNALELQLHWLEKVTTFASEHGRIPIFWDDMVFKLANLYETTYNNRLSDAEVAERWRRNEHFLTENAGLFPTNCTYMRWNYETPEIPGNLAAIDWYKRNNLSVMAATSAQSYSSMFPRTGVQFQPIKEFCMLTAKKKMDGILCTVWDDTSPHLETLTRGIHDFALFAWSDEDISEPDARRIYRHRFYGPSLADVPQDFQDVLERDTTPFWETAFLVKGDREVFHKQFELLDLPDPARTGSWSRSHADKLARAAAVRRKHDEIKQLLAEAARNARRNHYALSLFSVINELQQYSADLLLLMQRYDQAAKSRKPALAHDIESLVNGFPRIRNALEETYAQTKMMGNPPGYLLDSNFHEHLANAMNSTDWIFIYELPMNKKVSEWLRQLPPASKRK